MTDPKPATPATDEEIAGWTPDRNTPEALFARIAADAETIKAQAEEIAGMRDALIRLRDCNWVISPPDRMDAVRDIAREALAATEPKG